MISGKILNSSASLNNFVEISALDFIPGEQIDVYVRLFNEQLNIRYIPGSSSICTFTFNTSADTTFDVIGTYEARDNSMVYFTLSELQTTTLLGGNVSISIDELGDTTQITKGIIKNGFSRILETDC